MYEIFDFIIVGGGTAGSVLANRIANSSSKPKVLLLEGGGPNRSESLRLPKDRYAAFMNPSLNWGYSSVPQLHLDSKVIPCPRGRGLGGSSAINFASWLIGHQDDFNQWSALVGDECWRWDGEGGVKERFRKIENLRTNIDEQQAEFLNRDALAKHSTNGMVDLSFNQVWSELELLSFQAAKEFGQPLNGDINSGDPTGFGLGPTTYYNGLRVTGATAYLSSPPSNLTILTDSFVTKVIFDDSKKAGGVETGSGHIYQATKEVILSAGTFDSPKILLLSGVGPKADLFKLSIPITHDLPGVGKNMKDHCFITTTLLLKPQTSVGAREAKTNLQIEVDPLQDVGPQAPMGWLSSPVIKSSEEFSSLPEETQGFLQKVPSYEFLTTNVPLAVRDLSPDARVITFTACVMNAQSTGSITLASSNPSDPPLIDPNYVSHPYDRRVAIEALRAIVEYSRMPAFAAVTEKIIEGPDSGSDEDLWAHVKRAVQPVWHFAGTCRMGQDEDEMAVVDKDFKVKGVKALRVVDHSIAPLIVNNHTQSTCFLIGETAAEKIIAEYGL